MPLKSGYSRKTLSGNIAELRKSGMDAKQAAAASYRKAREAAKKKGKSPSFLKKPGGSTRLPKAY